jgi:C1A family cysteine protease
MWIDQRDLFFAMIDVRLQFDVLRTRAPCRTKKVTKHNSGHAVAIVGYTKIIFIIRNSWGPGYGRMAMLT